MVIRPIARAQRLDSALSEAALRERVLAFLAAAEHPRQWTFFLAGRPPIRGAPPFPELIIDAGGRIAYVNICRQGGGPLDSRRAAGLALARCRGAASFVVRSLPEMERVLRTLGIRLHPPGTLFATGSSQGGVGGADGARP